jgi:hypothetical protein
MDEGDLHPTAAGLIFPRYRVSCAPLSHAKLIPARPFTPATRASEVSRALFAPDIYHQLRPVWTCAAGAVVGWEVVGSV